MRKVLSICDGRVVGYIRLSLRQHNAEINCGRIASTVVVFFRPCSLCNGWNQKLRDAGIVLWRQSAVNTSAIGRNRVAMPTVDEFLLALVAAVRILASAIDQCLCLSVCLSFCALLLMSVVTFDAATCQAVCHPFVNLQALNLPYLVPMTYWSSYKGVIITARCTVHIVQSVPRHRTLCSWLSLCPSVTLVYRGG